MRSMSGGRAAVSKGAAIALAVGALAGCGAAADPVPSPTPDADQARAARVKRAESDGAVRDAVIRSYTSTDAADCGRVYTTAFIRDAFKGIAGCRQHVRRLAKLPKRTIRIISVHRTGPVADAKVRVDNFDFDRQARPHRDAVAGRRHGERDRQRAHEPLPVALRGPAGGQAEQTGAARPGGAVQARRRDRPEDQLQASVLRVVDHGFSRNGTRHANGPIYDDFGKVTNPSVRYRIVNIRVKLTNAGPKPFRGSISGALIGREGRHWEESRSTSAARRTGPTASARASRPPTASRAG